MGVADTCTAMPRKDKLLATASASTSARGTPVPAESEPSDDRYVSYGFLLYTWVFRVRKRGDTIPTFL